MMNYFKIFGIATLIFLVIDLIWLSSVGRHLYQSQLGELMGKTKWLPAIIFYVLFIIAAMFFVIQPAIEKDSWSYALLAGALFGLVTYGTYDLTNLATIKDWPVMITVIDLIWGTTLTSLTSVFTYLIYQKI